MALSPRAKERFKAAKQLGCFPRDGDKLRNSPGASRERGDGEFLRKTAKDVFEEKEKELKEIRSYWQEEYKSKVSEVANLEAALKEAVESRNIEVEELRMSYEGTINLQNSEISELRRTLDELMGTKEEILASAEKSTESRLRAKDAEVMRLRIWLEEAKKSNSQGREVLNSYQNRLRDKELEIEELKVSNKEDVMVLEHEVEKLKALLSEVIAEKDQDTESTKLTLDSVIEEKETQMAMMKESSQNVITMKDEENKRKEKDVQRLHGELAGKETEIEQLKDSITKLQSLVTVHEDERRKLTEALRSASESRRNEMAEVHECQQTLLDQKEKQLMSTEMLLKEKDRRIEELSAKLGFIEAQLASELSQKGSNDDLKSKIPSMLKKMNELNEEKGMLGKDIDALLMDVHSKEAKLNDIQKKFENESQEKQLLRQKCDSLTQDLDNWKCAMKLIEEERNSLENEVKRVGGELESKSSVCCEFELKVQSLESVRQNLEDVIRQLRNENANSFQGQKNLEFIIRERDREQNLLKEKLNMSEKRFAIEIEHRAMKEKNDAGMIESLKNKFKETERENKELKTNLDEREKDVASLSSLLEDAKQQEHKLEAELDELSEELEILKENCARGSNEKEALERSLTNAVSLKQQELEILQQQFEKNTNDWKQEIEKREECWKEALKAKDDLLNDVKVSFDERVKWKEDEIQELENSLQETKVEFHSVKEELEKGLKLKEEEIYLLEKTFDESLRGKEATLAEIIASNKDILYKSDEKKKELEECKAEVNKMTEMLRIKGCELSDTREKITELEAKLREKAKLLNNAETEIRELHTRINEEEENHVVEVKNVIQSAEEGFRERENVAEKMKAIIQENAVKYRLALRIKDDRISGLKTALENLNKDTEDMRVNLATIIQESSQNEAKLRHDLNKLEDEKILLENRLSELTKSLETRDEELKLMEGNFTSAVSNFEEQQKVQDDQKEEVLEALNHERLKMKELEESYLSLKLESEQKDQSLQQIKEKCEKLERELEDFNQVKNLVKLAEREKTCADEAKQDLLQELDMLKRFSDAKEGKIGVLLHKVKMLKKNHFEAAQKQEKLEENVVTLQIKLNEKEAQTNELENERAIKEEESSKHFVLLEEMRLKKEELEKQIPELEEIVNAQKAEIEEAKQREDELKQAVQELLASLKEKELNSRALVSNVKEGKTENEKLRSEYENFKTSALTKQDRMQNELDHLHSELDRHEGLLVMLNKEKESLLGELGKTRQAEENTKATLEYYIRGLKGENESLTSKIASLDEESKQRVAEFSELHTALTSAEVSKEFLRHEIENLKVSTSAKDASLCEAHQSFEAVQKENSCLKFEIKSLKASLNREMSEKNNLVESFEEVKSTTVQVKRKMDDVLLEKENMITSSEKFMLRMKQENESLKARLFKCEAELKADKKCVATLLEKRKEMSAQIESLSKDKEILSASLKDMDILPVKLKSTQESLGKTKDSLKVLKGQLKEKMEEQKYLAKTVRELESTNVEMKKKLEVQTTVKEAELVLIKKQLEDKNKEFYDLKVANTAQEMSLREAQFKIKDLESSLKNEIAFHQSIARRNDQLQQEIMIVQERNKNDITSLKKSLDDAIGREIFVRDKCHENSRAHCVEKIDNKTVQKLKELYFKVSELETQLNRERNEHLLSLAQVREEGRRYITGELRAE